MSALTSLEIAFLDRNSLSGTIPSTMSALTSLRYLSLFNNYLTMGGATSVPLSTFSSTTLLGTIYLERNCLVFDTTSPYPERHVTATHCRSSGKYKICCLDILFFDLIIFFVYNYLVMLLHTTVIALFSLPHCLSSISFLITFRFPADAKDSTVSGYWGLIALILIPLGVVFTRYYCCSCKRQIQTPGANLVEQRRNQVLEQEMENADAQSVIEIQSVTVAEEIMHDQQMVGDSHITIVSSAYVYQTAIILTDVEIALHSTEPLCSAEIVQ